MYRMFEKERTISSRDSHSVCSFASKDKERLLRLDYGTKSCTNSRRNLNSPTRLKHMDYRRFASVQVENFMSEC